MDALAEKLDARLREWKPETAAEARERIAEVIELADHALWQLRRGSFRRPFQIKRESQGTLEPFHCLSREPANPAFKTHGWQGS